MSHVDHDPFESVPRVRFWPFSISGCRRPSFHRRVRRRRPEAFALVSGSLTLGFGYPLGEMAWLPHPWGPISAPNALGLHSSELFSFQVIEKPFRIFLSVPALPGKTLTTLPRRFNGLLPPEKPFPLLLPEGLVRVGIVCSPELSDL